MISALRVVFILLQLQSTHGEPGITYREDGDFVIGAILPITKHTGGGDEKCSRVNPKGVALTEAIINSIYKIRSDPQFTSLMSSKKFGFEIHDSCNDPVIERDIAYKLNKVALNYAQNDSAPRPVDIVISSFGKDSIKALDLLNIENIPQISYSKTNVKLLEDSNQNGDNVKRLISSYPENTGQIKAIIDIIKEFRFQYVYALFSGDYQGYKGRVIFRREMSRQDICHTSFSVNEIDIPKVVAELKKNALVKVLVLHCSQDIEIKLFEELHTQGLTRFIILSTTNWLKSESTLKKFPEVTEGMTYLENIKVVESLQGHFRDISRPYTQRDWVKRLFYRYGGNDTCLSSNIRDATTEPCWKAEIQVRQQLQEVAKKSVYAYDAVYTIAHALLKGGNVINAINGLTFTIPTLSRNTITYTEHLTAVVNNFNLYNIQRDTSHSFWVGTWKKPKNNNDGIYDPLTMQKDRIRWKNRSTVVPSSVCSPTCQMGFKRKFIDSNSKCCWTCERCPNDTFSNTTNSDQCLTCGPGCVPTPDRTGFVYYKLQRFNWLGSVGGFLIFLIVVAFCFIFLAFGVFTHYDHHDLVHLSGYFPLCFFLLGCLLLCLAPLPLLATPSSSACSAYICLFNFGLSMAFSVLITRSAYVNGFYDPDNGHVVKEGLGKYPRLSIICLIMCIQILVLSIGLSVDPPQTLHNKTNQWDVRYWECSSWASYAFWVAFGYNIALSIVGNFMSCSSTKLEYLRCELKWILLTYLIFYLAGIVEIVLFYRIGDEALASGQAIMCVVFAMVFYFLFVWPKVFYLLFRAKNDKTSLRNGHLLNDDDAHEKSGLTTAMSVSDGYRNHGVVQMRLKEAENNNPHV